MTASTSDTMRLMSMVHGNQKIKSAWTPVRVRRNGKKITQMQSVASIIGIKYFCAEWAAACHRDIPLLTNSR